VIGGATDPVTGQIDTGALATQIGAAGTQDMNVASAAYGAIRAQLQQQDPAAASQFDQQVANAFLQYGSDALAGTGTGLLASGRDILIDNPILLKSWESTTSVWTGQGGFTQGLQSLLEANGIQVSPNVNPVPPGSIPSNAGVPSSVANNTNGALARDAIANSYSAQGYQVDTEVPRPDYNRRIDVVTQVPADDPRYNTVIETESKVGRTGLSPSISDRVASDAQALADNGAIRGAGDVLETAGKVAVPLAIAGDAIQLGQAFQQDGGTIGVNTGRTAAGVAGGWGGAFAGAEGGAALGATVGSVVPGAWAPPPAAWSAGSLEALPVVSAATGLVAVPSMRCVAGSNRGIAWLHG
jgi:hypothetical protein